MKEVIVSMSVMIPDDTEDEDWAIEEACSEALEEGWQFSKAQRVVINRSDVHPDNFVIGYFNHKIVTHPKADVLYELWNEL